MATDNPQIEIDGHKAWLLFIPLYARTSNDIKIEPFTDLSRTHDLRGAYAVTTKGAYFVFAGEWELCPTAQPWHFIAVAFLKWALSGLEPRDRRIKTLTETLGEIASLADEYGEFPAMREVRELAQTALYDNE